MKCEARTWSQVQAPRGVKWRQEMGRCSRDGKHILDGHHCCTHHYNKPPTFGWQAGAGPSNVVQIGERPFDVGTPTRCWKCGTGVDVHRQGGDGGYVYGCRACGHPAD